MKKLLSFICVLAAFTTAGAQTFFRYRTPLNAVDSTGYSRLLLAPEVRGEMRAGFEDLRIYDSENHVVPFVIATEKPVPPVTRFVQYPVKEQHDEPGDCWITVENPLYKTENLSHICLEVNNTEVQRGMILSGSYDNVKWYALKDEFVTSFYESFERGAKATTNIVRFDFPLSDYRYFRFNFDNWWWWHDYRNPVFIARAGVLVTTPAVVEDQRMEISGVLFSAKQYGKTTAVDITLPGQPYVDYLRFDLAAAAGPGTFYRGAHLYIADSSHHCDKATSGYIAADVLSNTSKNEFDLRGRHESHFCLHIENEDDQPLLVNGVHATGMRKYAIAYLEKGESYFLYYGNDTIGAARYDLRYQQDALSSAPMNVIGTGKPESIAIAALPQPIPENNNQLYIWLAIGVVVLILGWMSVKMLREMKPE
jgi:hypothetical protein